MTVTSQSHLCLAPKPHHTHYLDGFTNVQAKVLGTPSPILLEGGETLARPSGPLH